MNHPIRLAGLGAVLLMAACAGGDEERPTQLQVFDTVRASVAARTAQRGDVQVEYAPPTRRQLDNIDQPVIEVRLERSAAFDFLYAEAERRDSGPGEIQVWRGSDAVTLATRNGVLIATRGLRGDILSSEVQVSGDTPGPSGGGARVQMIRGLDNKEQRLVLTCEVTDLGPEPVTIVERTHPTRHLRERCEGGGGEIVNDYWVESGRRTVWQSRQWAGPHIGYMRLRRLTN